jgi:uncharacterized membrane-anchored protein
MTFASVAAGHSTPQAESKRIVSARIVMPIIGAVELRDLLTQLINALTEQGMINPESSLVLLVCLIAVLSLWYWSQGTISVNMVSTPRVEAFYWAAITFSQTLGTALGDWMAGTGGLGYESGAFVFAVGLAMIVGLYIWTNVSRVLLFWAAFILTRPLGATVGDFLDKPVNREASQLSRPFASAVIGALILLCLAILPQRAGRHPGAPAAVTIGD